MAFSNFMPPSTKVQKWAGPTMAAMPLTLQPPEVLRARLAALGLSPGAINAGQTSLVGEYDQPETPAGGFQFQLAGYRGGPAQFSSGGAGFRPLAANQGGTPAPSPMQAFGAQFRPLPPRTVPPQRPGLGTSPTFNYSRPGGLRNPLNLANFTAYKKKYPTGR
jgi:hypothetical protein